MSLRVLVVDDTILFRKIITEAISGIPGVEVVGSAANGKIALTRIKTLKPDILTLDMEMPEMNGLELLEAIRQEALDTSAILVSCLTVHGSELTMKGFDLGAFDFITKPEGGEVLENIIAIREALAPRFKAFIAQKNSRATSTAPLPLLQVPVSAPLPRVPAKTASITPAPPTPLAVAPRSGQRFDAVAIGISTGGPKALNDMLPSLPGNLGIPVFIVQHMPPIFTASLANTLNSRCAMRVKEAEQDEKVLPDTAYIAPGGKQMKIVMAADGVTRLIRLTDDPPENNCRPAVDYLFRSISQQYPGRAVGVIMTGMGCDGATGIRLMKRNGAHIIAQDEATCVVYGMPKAAVATGVVDVVAPLGTIAAEIAKSLGVLYPACRSDISKE